MKVKWEIGDRRLWIMQRTSEMKNREKIKDDDQIKTQIKGAFEKFTS